MGSTRRSFTDEYRQQAVEFVLDQGRSIAEVARNIGCHEMTLGKWVKKERDARELQRLDADEALTESERAELIRLRVKDKDDTARIAHLEMQVAFAKKVAAWFANGQR